ncbi:ankyrin repeat-containing domain protein [Lasiosphaeris hirsuta]|uniref:Ankyrin repeat-containing domain protein n=1 Tax=Lasiosphaeris hirsuta TaxID=260670 RepID=A0AA40DM04_9PEZI|nr:ankyrin repeat-containing domain protein [Lasiosphaeris hirsuta]
MSSESNAKPETTDQNPFHLGTAATNGHANLIELLLEEPNININEADERGRTPLILAASNGHAEVVELLLEYQPPVGDRLKSKAAVNQQSLDGFTALRAALSGDHAAVAEVLLREEDIDVTREYRENWTPLGAASVAGHLKVVKAIVRKLVRKNKTEALHVKHRAESLEGTPLFLAADGGHTKVVNLLLQHHDPIPQKKLQQINETNNGGRTALLAAATNGHVDVVALLLAEDADATIQSGEGMTALKAAILGGHVGVVKLLFEKNKSSLPAPKNTEKGAKEAYPEEKEESEKRQEKKEVTE